MANNPALYNAALSGITGGAQQARWITDQVSANYASFRAAVVAFATAVDAAIPVIVTGGSVAECQLLQSICEGVSAERLISSTISGDYINIAAAIAALFTEQQGGLDPTGNPGLGVGTYPNQPLVWDGAAWIPAPGAVAAGSHTGIDNSVAISLPTPTPGFATRCSWFIESANMFDLERDNVLFRRRWKFVGDFNSPLQMIAPDAAPSLIGFLGATPVLRQVLTASLANQQAQINDIVTALVNLGLVTDSRVP
jgi:hypothetical protein